MSRTLIDRRILGLSVLLYRTQGGQAVALDNRCLHRSFPLSKGYLDGDNVVCGYHGLTYNSCGACVRVPSQAQAPRGLQLRRYPLVERNGLIWIWTGEPERADAGLIPDFLSPEAAGWAVCAGYVNIRANYIGLHENLLDLTHFTYLHKDVGIGSPELVATQLEVAVRDIQVQARLMVADSPAPAAYRQTLGLDADERIDREMTFGFVTPALSAGGSVLRRKGGERSEYTTWTLHFITPETQDSMHYFWYTMRNFLIDSQPLTQLSEQASIKAFREDKNALEWISELLRQDPREQFRETSFRSDKGSLQMRRVLQELAEAERE